MRNKPCPLCGSRSGFAVDPQSGGYNCFRCGEHGHIGQLDIDLDINYEKITQYDNPKINKVAKNDAPRIWETLTEARSGGLTSAYLLSRGISYSAWSDLGLREGEVWGKSVVAAYSFYDAYGRIKAIHFTSINKGKREKRYSGPKSQGVALLKPAPIIIIAEGLENALAVRQRYGNHYGILVGGDAGNIKKYATEHQMILSQYTYIMVMDGDAEGKRASDKFQMNYKVREVFRGGQLNDAIDLLT